MLVKSGAWLSPHNEGRTGAERDFTALARIQMSCKIKSGFLCRKPEVLNERYFPAGVHGSNAKSAVIVWLLSVIFRTVTPEYPNFGSDPAQK